MSRLHSLAVAAALVLCAPRLAAQEPPVKPDDLTGYWWTFLVSGDNKTPLAKEDAEKMQAAHIANLTRLGNEGKAITAGPFGDRTPLRGIVITTLKTKVEVDTEFKDDPFVKAGYLKPESFQWYTFKNSFGKHAEPFEMAKHQFVLYKKGPKYDPKDFTFAAAAQNEHLRRIVEARKQGVVALAGPLFEAGNRIGVLVFRSDDEAKAKVWVEGDPHIKSGGLVAEFHPLYLGKGVLDPK